MGSISVTNDKHAAERVGNYNQYISEGLGTSEKVSGQ